MPKRQQNRTQQQRLSQQFGALSLDKGPIATGPLDPPPEPDPFSFASSSSTSSVIMESRGRSESPDLALMGSAPPQPIVPPLEPPPPSNPGSTLADKTFNAKADMPKWMADVTAGFAKEVSTLMQDMDDLRKQKQGLQMEISTLMSTLSQYSAGGQYAPHWSQPMTIAPPEASAPQPDSSPDSSAMIPAGPAKPGWRTVRPEPKKIQSKVVHSAPAPKALPPPLPTPTSFTQPQSFHPHQQMYGHSQGPPPTSKAPTWATWQPHGSRKPSGSHTSNLFGE